jgi:hypothetical protein
LTVVNAKYHACLSSQRMLSVCSIPVPCLDAIA